ncbi:hypothetical protein [Streptomyces sp. RG80]|uniref:hypothetical protein n=1 Tax=Streptomyces sp. RG80 TaxID=3157340 RepID=UPI00338D98B1
MLRTTRTEGHASARRGSSRNARTWPRIVRNPSHPGYAGISSSRRTGSPVGFRAVVGGHRDPAGLGGVVALVLPVLGGFWHRSWGAVAERHCSSDHDTVIVQLDGAKRWRIYGTTRPFPLYRDIEDPGEAPTEPVADLVL